MLRKFLSALCMLALCAAAHASANYQFAYKGKAEFSAVTGSGTFTVAQFGLDTAQPVLAIHGTVTHNSEDPFSAATSGTMSGIVPDYYHDNMLGAAYPGALLFSVKGLTFTVIRSQATATEPGTYMHVTLYSGMDALTGKQSYFVRNDFPSFFGIAPYYFVVPVDLTVLPVSGAQLPMAR